MERTLQILLSKIAVTICGLLKSKCLIANVYRPKALPVGVNSCMLWTILNLLAGNDNKDAIVIIIT